MRRLVRPIGLSWSTRFALALSAVFVLGSLSSAGLTHLFLSRELTRKLDADVQADAESLARLAEAGDTSDLEEQIAAESRVGRNGGRLVAFYDEGKGAISGTLAIAEPFAGARRLVAGRDFPVLQHQGPERGMNYRAFGIRTEGGWVMVAEDEALVTESGEILAQATALALAISLLLCLGLAVAVARRNDRRIARMEGVLNDVGGGRLDSRIRDAGGDDLGRVSLHVDQMLDRLEEGVAVIRQVSTDVAHDLRAPLARLRIRLEPLALSSSLAPDTRHELGSALSDIDAISATFDAILRLARLQSGAVTLRDEALDLCRLAEDVDEIMRPAAEDAGHVLSLMVPPEPVLLRGDAELLTQALVNLLANAIQHCPPPARIEIAVQRRGDQAALSVADDGPGIPAHEHARVRRRFVRLDASRSVPGTGLGMSLVEAIADLHGARLLLEDNKPGLRATILFDARKAG